MTSTVISRELNGTNIEVRAVGPVIVGSGVAGLSTALGLQGCTVVTADVLGQGGSTPLAQGGVAAAVGAGDRVHFHVADTVQVAGGLADRDVVALVTGGGPAAIEELLRLGTRFDRDDDGQLALGREAGHSARRIVHANGDATGAAIAAALTKAVRARPDVEVLERTYAVDLVQGDDGVTGVLTISDQGELLVLLSPAVVLATGGYAHCFARTTTPPGTIGAGLAMAARAGARLADLELVQFHPTALDVDGDAPLPLLTEALRGEGAILVDAAGRRYLLGEHADAEMAPRDVVARANYRQLVTGGRPRLDGRSAIGDDFPQRFPTVFALARQHGFDPRIEALPVTPAAHYCMGGVAVDVDGRTSLSGLWAVGETTSSGMHGANRLASNSLLEGLVLGRQAAVSITLAIPPRWAGVADRVLLPADLERLDCIGAGDGEEQLVKRLRGILWSGAGVERHEAGLRRSLAQLDELAGLAAGHLRTRTVHTVAKLVVAAALRRTESRGAHYRSDYPRPNPSQAERFVVDPVGVDLSLWSSARSEHQAMA